MPLADAARASSSVFLDVASLVLLSIQQPWYGMPRQFADVRDKGAASIYLFGAKRAGYEYVKANADTLRHAAIAAHEANDLDSLILTYLDIPNVGLAKASFLAQMTIADGACLDVHNQRRIGLNPRVAIMGKTLTLPFKLKKVSLYNSAWRSYGTSAYWWNIWCDALVHSPYNRFETGSDVSKMHLLPLT